LGAVASDLLGVSSRKILREIVAGVNTDPAALADLALGKLRDKREDLILALEGRVTDHNRFMMGQLLDHIDELDRRIHTFEERIEALSAPFKRAVVVVDSVPAVSTTAAHAILSEIGCDMSRFASGNHLSSWLGVCPGNNESGGKRLSGRTRKGNRYARAALVAYSQEQVPYLRQSLRACGSGSSSAGGVSDASDAVRRAVSSHCSTTWQEAGVDRGGACAGTHDLPPTQERR
jgi:transposase